MCCMSLPHIYFIRKVFHWCTSVLYNIIYSNSCLLSISKRKKKPSTYIFVRSSCQCKKNGEKLSRCLSLGYQDEIFGVFSHSPHPIDKKIWKSAFIQQLVRTYICTDTDTWQNKMRMTHFCYQSDLCLPIVPKYSGSSVSLIHYMPYTIHMKHMYCNPTYIKFVFPSMFCCKRSVLDITTCMCYLYTHTHFYSSLDHNNRLSNKARNYFIYYVSIYRHFMFLSICL